MNSNFNPVISARIRELSEAFSTRAVLVFLQPYLIGMRVDIFGDYRCPNVIADNLRSASRSEHIDVELHFIRDFIQAGEIRVLPVGTEEQHANVLTKSLWRKKFMLHRGALMNLSLGSSRHGSFFPGILITSW